MSQHQNKIARASIISGVVGTIAVITFFFKGYGNMVLAQKDVDDVKLFVDKQKEINLETAEIHAKIQNDLDWIKGFLKNNVK